MSRIRIFTRALTIQASLGTRIAARYLYLRGVSLDTALYLLTVRPRATR